MRLIRLSVCWLLGCVLMGQSPLKKGSPLDALPPNMEVLTYFGERADFSPDNQEIAFMGKSFGDAFVINLKTRQIRCLTCNVPGAAFLRVMHLANGDYLLIGPERFTDIRTSRSRDNELWYLSRKSGSKPVRLVQKMSEGAAVSKRTLRIAFAETSAQNPKLPAGSSRILTAEVDPDEPALRNKRIVITSPDNSCTLEAQDFFDKDTKLTYTCYERGGTASVWTMDLQTGERINQSRAIGSYNEVEGIFPDGLHTCVESDRQAVLRGSTQLFRDVDIWKLRLDGTGKSFERLTYFNDYEGWKASNPVVSTDGRLLAFQVARTADEAGVGYGIVLMRLQP
ncbi:MAG: hypothetical protein K6T61_02230 [Bryobacteraceae bacterium]|nr:hypothetical protein [Bryobacteraceae bacterium]